MNPGLSAFRFYLAICVLVSHFAGPDIWGDGAVEAFFCISGFLVTFIVNEKYVGRSWAYLLNRFLRIYPTYWACLALSAGAIAAFPYVAPTVNKALGLPTTIADFVPQLVIFGLYDKHPISLRMLPPAWSLNVELYFYLVIGLFTATRPRLTLALGLGSFVIGVLCASGLLPFPFYGDPIGNAQPFFLGSFAYQSFRQREFTKLQTAFLLSVFLIVQLLPSAHHLAERILLTSIAAPFVIVSIWKTNLGFDPRVARLMDLLGRLSYPIFLLHWIVAIPFVAAGFHGIGAFALVLPGTIGAAVLVHILVEVPIERIRTMIRRSEYAEPADIKIV